MSEDVFNGVGVPVKLANPDDFLKVKETLTRIGVSSSKNKILYQSCHILHKKGEYAIVHFKELFKLDGKATNIDDSDIERRNAIAKLLAQWGLLSIIDEKKAEPAALINQLKILSFKEKDEWELVAKYNIGKKVKPAS
jgi:hypothetical protein